MVNSLFLAATTTSPVSTSSDTSCPIGDTEWHFKSPELRRHCEIFHLTVKSSRVLGFITASRSGSPHLIDRTRRHPDHSNDHICSVISVFIHPQSRLTVLILALLDSQCSNMSMPLPSSVIHSVVEPALGGLFIAILLGSILFGVTILQTYIYYDRFWGDPWYLKLLVAVLFLLDSGQIASVVDSFWFYIIPNFGNVAALSGAQPGLSVEIGLTVSIGLLVQSFFAVRVWHMSDRQRIIPMTIAALTLAQFALGIYYTAASRIVHDETAIEQRIESASLGSLSCSMAADFIITLSLVYYLHKGRSGFKRTDRLINVLIIYTVNTGLLTSLTAALTITFNQVIPTRFWDVVPYFLLSKFYVNSMLATLNARSKLHSISTGLTSGSAQLDTGMPHDGSNTMVHRNRPGDIVSEIQFASGTERTNESKQIESILVPEV
ncbi:hypothetical protein OBBRIDRAFT_889376 [Obba rivulosa]|uniref:DUF6534 domain-containing protein n=1 Tax=Obba rivulosa TaxID=1052685 RepID=A0A8E2AU41_9APHY|nr:hypothetical protein OBBRIDRAFT_889376 [Obba rivulosa]